MGHGEREAEEAEAPFAEVPKGQVRLEGHFCGVAVTASHRLELAIPIFEEVDINLLFPLLSGFKASREAKEGLPQIPESPTSPASLCDPEIWTSLEQILECDRKDVEDEEEGEVIEDMMDSMVGPNWRETMGCGSRRNSFERAVSILSESDAELAQKLKEEERELRATKAHERAMEVDFQAKEALVQNLMEERKMLKAKTQMLTKQLETNVAERWLCSCLGGFTKLFQKSEDEGVQLEVIAEALEEKEEAAIKSEVGRVKELEKGQVIIEGHFTGQMVTQAHFMEVAMPLGATMPGVPVVELLRAMYDACKEMEDDAKRKSAEVLSGVLALLEVDILPETELGQDGETEEEILTEVPVPTTEAGALERLSEMSKEIETLRSEQMRFQQEAEQLRLKNATLATFLASAERSAVQLRSALTEAGLHCQGDDSPSSPGGAQDMARSLKALESWAARLRGGSPKKSCA